MTKTVTCSKSSGATRQDHPGFSLKKDEIVDSMIPGWGFRVVGCGLWLLDCEPRPRTNWKYAFDQTESDGSPKISNL